MAFLPSSGVLPWAQTPSASTVWPSTTAVQRLGTMFTACPPDSRLTPEPDRGTDARTRAMPFSPHSTGNSASGVKP